LWSGKIGDRKLRFSEPIFILGMKPNLYPIINLMCLSGRVERETGMAAAFDFYLKYLSALWILVLTGCLHVV
jgi:hypothetical protein